MGGPKGHSPPLPNRFCSFSTPPTFNFMWAIIDTGGFRGGVGYMYMYIMINVHIFQSILKS